MTTTSDFSKVIECYLLEKAQTEPEFKKKFDAKDKNISDCVTYILNVVKATKCQGFTDDEVYQMAINYYEIKNVEVGKRFDAKAVVNHSIDTPEYLRYKVTAEEKKLLSNQINETTNQEVLKCLESDLLDLRENPLKYWQSLDLESYKNDADNQQRFKEVSTMLNHYTKLEEEKKKQEQERKERQAKLKKTRAKKTTTKKPTNKQTTAKKTATPKVEKVKEESKFKTPPPIQAKTDKNGQASLF